MTQDRMTSLARGFVVGVVALIMLLAALGVGISVGAHTQRGPAAGQSWAPQAEMGAAELDSASKATPQLAPAASSTASSTVASSGQDSLDRALFDEAWKLLQAQYYGELPKGKEITYDAIRGVVDSLGDQHTMFVDPQHAALFTADMEGRFEGIGARVDLAEGGGVELKYLFPGQPAEKAGLRAGDVIVAVDGKKLPVKTDLAEAIGLIRGPHGSQVVLTIRRGEEAPFDVTVERASIEIPVVETKSLADGRIAYIALSEFSSVAPERLASALQEVLAAKPKGLILDLRGNPGGLLDAAVRIGSYFVPKGSILIERTKDGVERVYEREGKYLLGETPLVVLVDAGSASASEIVAGAIQDAGSGVLIGEKTYGKGSVQLPNSLSDGSQLRVTIARWFTPKDRAIHGVGLEPDIVVPLTQADVDAKRDPQLDRAVERLLQGK